MKYTLAVFRTRFATLSFANMLRAKNIPVAIISTPRAISRTCGISVKFLSDFLPLVQKMCARVDSRNFDGFYAVDYSGNVKRIMF